MEIAITYIIGIIILLFVYTITDPFEKSGKMPLLRHPPPPPPRQKKLLIKKNAIKL